MAKRTIELTWICSTCGKTNRGRDTRCASCGKPKESEKYDMPGDTTSVPSVTDPERLREAAAGSNWTCEFCGSHQRALNGGCQECGAGKPEPVARIELSKVHRELPENFDEPEDVAPSRISIKKILAYAGAGIGGAAAISSFIWLMVFLFGTHEVEAQVSAIRWQHTVTLEQRYTLSGSGWDSGMPGGSFNVSCQTKQRGTENCNPYQCNPHQAEYQCNPHDCNSRTETYDCSPHDCNCREVCTDNGNGYASCDNECDTCYETCEREIHDTCYDTCERTEYDTCYHQCPVYDQWCTYNYYEWRAEQTEHTSGSAHDESWPALTASGATQRLQKRATYSVNFRNDEDSWNYTAPNLSDFRRFNPSERWLLKVNRAGMVWPQKRI